MVWHKLIIFFNFFEKDWNCLVNLTIENHIFRMLCGQNITQPRMNFITTNYSSSNSSIVNQFSLNIANHTSSNGSKTKKQISVCLDQQVIYAPTCSIVIWPLLVRTYHNSKTWWNTFYLFICLLRREESK